jgi:monoamine oxidase
MALTDCGWVPQNEVEWAMDWALTVDDPGFAARLQSLHGALPDPTYQWWGKDDNFVIEQDPRGYAKVLDHMVKDTVPPGDSRVVFGAFVSKIAYDCDGATLTTRDGRSFSAKEVISTLPLGVLQRKHADLFEPPLPKKHADLLNDHGLVMGNLTHVVLQFPTVWWDDSLPRWMSAIHGANTSRASGEFSEWQNLNYASFIPGSQMLLSFLGDPQSSIYEGMSNEEAQAAAMRSLRAQHPQKSIPDPVAFFMSRWGYGGASYGAYSGIEPGFKDKFFETLTKPLKACGQARIRFAGEAMCDNLSGFTHGARQSGLEVAARYLHSVGKGPNPDKKDSTSLCNW